MGISQIPNTVPYKRTQTITSSTTWTVPSGVNSVDVTCIGAGAAIGGAGAVVKRTIDTSTLQGTGISVTIGASPNPGVNGSGGNTSFGSFITAGGGFAGEASNTVTGFPGMSGTRFDSSVTVPQDSTLVPFISTYGEQSQFSYNIVYNSSIGLYVTSGTQNTTSGVVVYYTSPDGTTWTRRTVGFSSGFGGVIGLFSLNNRLFLLTRSNGNGIYYKVSSNGTTWSSEFIITTSGATFHGMTFSSTSAKYYWSYRDTNNYAVMHSVAAANVDTVQASFEVQVASATATVWQSTWMGNGTNLLLAFAVQGGTVYKFIYNGTNLTTPTDANWSSSLYPTSGAWDGSKITLVTNTGAIYTTTNGTTYTNASVNIPGLWIQGYSGGYYYGHINNTLAYSSDGTTWTRTSVYLSNKPTVSNSQYNSYFANGVNIFISSNCQQTGMLENFNITSPNTTVAKGYLGLGNYSYYSSGTVGGGAGGVGNPIFYWSGSQNYTNYSSSPGIDGYGIATPINFTGALVATNVLPFGSTNGSIGTQGAVVLSWMQ